ncbi:MAG: protein translocase subunit SecD, partial [Planctomycetota bacterium]
MNKLWTNIGLVIALILICLAVIHPPERNLRLGKDLAGGVSLTYTITVPEDSKDQQGDIDKLITVLGDRVNPTGALEIVFEQIGRDRLEITMPLPSDAVKAIRDAYEAELAKFDAYSVEVGAFERAMRQQGQGQIAALRSLADTEARQVLLEPVITAAEAAGEARQRYTDAEIAGFASEEEELELLNAAGMAQQELLVSREALLDRLVTTAELERVLELPEERVFLEGVLIPSQRSLSLESIRERVADLPRASGLVGEPIIDPEEAATMGIAKQAEIFAEMAQDETLERGSIIAAYNNFRASRDGLDDPNDLKRLLRGAGVLEFRIAAESEANALDAAGLREQLRVAGPAGVTSERFVWSPINKLSDWSQNVQQLEAAIANPVGFFTSIGLIGEVYQGQVYLLLYDTPEMRLTQAEANGQWQVTSAAPSRDSYGRDAVSYTMNPLGGSEMVRLTEPNRGRPMAVLLDDKIYTAPNINSTLARNIQITGSFSASDIQYLIKTLNAGSVAATLSVEPISENTIAPELGQDNLDAGMEASYWALGAVGVFMVLYYFAMGVIALMCLSASAVMILGAMALAESAFTLPGIAGIVLTFGMAVDANVLIYERIREEIFAGEDLRSAVRIAFKKVLSTIVDANVTNLIVCFVLFYTATQEIKGFAVTLGIGVVATMFSALVIAKLIFSAVVDEMKVKKMSQLPIAIPAIDRLLTPKVNWIKLRPAFAIISLVLLSTGG